MKPPLPCVIDGCSKARNTKGLCTSHQRRLRVYGDPLLNAAGVRSVGPASDEDRFFTKVNKNGPVARPGLEPCWIWLASVRADGYGQFWFRNAQNTAHRASYMMFVGPIPEGMVMLHLCDVPLCVRPDHLSAGTQADNIRDSFRRDRRPKTKACPHGHIFDAENTRLDKRGHRRCIACRRDRDRRAWQTHKAALTAS